MSDIITEILDEEGLDQPYSTVKLPSGIYIKGIYSSTCNDKHKLLRIEYIEDFKDKTLVVDVYIDKTTPSASFNVEVTEGITLRSVFSGSSLRSLRKPAAIMLVRYIEYVRTEDNIGPVLKNDYIGADYTGRDRKEIETVREQYKVHEPISIIRRTNRIVVKQNDGFCLWFVPIDGRLHRKAHSDIFTYTLGYQGDEPSNLDIVRVYCFHKYLEKRLADHANNRS
jgi:hypothetical protein